MDNAKAIKASTVKLIDEQVYDRLSGTDRSDYYNAIMQFNKGDRSFKAIIEYFENGKSPNTKWFYEFRSLLRTAMKSRTYGEVKALMGGRIGETTIKNVLAGRTTTLKESTAQTHYYTLKSKLKG